MLNIFFFLLSVSQRGVRNRIRASLGFESALEIRSRAARATSAASARRAERRAASSLAARRGPQQSSK